MADDFSDSITTTGTLSVGGSTNGNIDSYSDNDWFKISLKAGTTYLFSLAGDGGSGALSNLNNVGISVYNAQGASVQYLQTYTTTSGAVAQFAAQVSGTYFVGVRSYSNTGGYTLTAATPAADDYSATTQTTGRLDNGVAVSGVFERTDDVDWFKFHADAGQVVGFSGTGVLGAAVDYYSSPTVYNANGGYVGLLGQAPFIATTSGDYYLALSANGRVGAYTRTMQLISDDYSSDSSRSGQLSAGGQVSGSTDYYGDVDRFQISLEAGSIYSFTLKPQDASNAGASLDVYLPSGTSDYYNVNSSTASDGSITLLYQASTAGVYGIVVAGNKVQAYTLSASAGEPDDYGNTQATATELQLGVPVSARSQSTSDIDMFKVDLKAGVTYSFNVKPDAANLGYTIRSILQDSSGQTVATNVYSIERYSYTPTKDGSFYLAQSSYYVSNGTLGFTLTASQAVDDFTANTSKPGRLSVGGSTKGVIESAGDRDWFAVSLDAGGYYWFRVDGSAEGGGTMSSYSPVTLKLLDGSGNVLVSTPSYNYYGNGTGTFVPFTATTKGTYYVEVGTTSGGTPSSGSYTVRAQLGKPDDYGNDKEHAAALAPDTIVKGEMELNTDKDVFKLDVVAGVTYAVEMMPLSPNADGLSIDVSGPAGLNVRYVSSGDSKVIRLFEATDSGSYYATVAASSNYKWTGGYTLVAKSMGKDDFSADSKTSAVVTPDAPLRGVIGVADDHDWIKVHLDAGRTYVFDLQGNKSGGGTLDTGTQYGYTAGMTLLSSDRGTLAYSAIPAAANGVDPRITYVATASGDYYLDVRGTGQASGTGSYTVEMVQTNLDTTGPKLLSSNIAAGATEVGIKPTITLTFDETIMLSGVALTDGYGAVVQGANGPVLASVAGHTLTVDPRTNLMPGMTYTLNLLKGSVTDLAGNAASDAQSFSFTVAKPVSSGTAGNDYLIGSGIGLTLDGGAGVDTVYYAVNRSNFNIVRGSDGGVTVRDVRASGTSGDKLSGIERLVFGDGTAYALDTEGVGGQAYRLYQSAFNRAPDADGLGFWIANLDKGLSLRDAASAFIASAEFTRTYGSGVNDTDFVKLLYQNVLHRAPDAAGNSFWLDNLQKGQSRAEVLVAFSESTENHDAVAKLIGSAIAYTPFGG
ncbi:DUF4214 domain-containing protein [Duganella sp. FT50W]|uniref:DUF4214 domain-containing protein n=1 Tax=Duganella lactea TaxID=2692173 RepID=A0A6L8MT37_9BURK|nr:DUF4214 domain-containing protein [Duganella lactea]MYM85184.1 DUF4214 domain-containing protein [Duganella lactea]